MLGFFVWSLLCGVALARHSQSCVCIPEAICRSDNCVPTENNPCYSYRPIHSNCANPDEKCCVRDVEPRKRREVTKCGVTSSESSIVPKWTVSLHNQDDGGKVMCTATLIGPKSALTVAHCVTAKQIANKQLAVKTTSGVLKLVRKVVVHENYVVRKSNYDIAFLELEEPFSDEEAEFLCLPSEGYVKKDCVISSYSYGKRYEDIPARFYRTTADVMSDEKCEKTVPSSYSSAEGIKCVSGEDFIGGCAGGSGGSLACKKSKDSDARVVVGLTAFGSNQACNKKGFPEFYIDVPLHAAWIRQNLGLISSS